MENSTVTHITENGKYEIQYEKAASANKIDGFKVQAHGDDIEQVLKDARHLYWEALAEVEKTKPVVIPAPAKVG